MFHVETFAVQSAGMFHVEHSLPFPVGRLAGYTKGPFVWRKRSLLTRVRIGDMFHVEHRRPFSIKKEPNLKLSNDFPLNGRLLPSVKERKPHTS